jgi:parvulin-like peptidyl-prolyl isomerase
VNGTPVREIDLELKLKNEMHGTELKPEYRQNVLDAVVRDEVLASEAERLGLDRDEGYLLGLRPLQAQVDAYRRRRLAERYLDHAAAAAAVGDADARRYFDAHAAEIRSELHVFQILARDEGAARAARAALDGGKPFEEVARLVLGGVAEAERPWDLGWMKWVMIPEPWRPVVAAMKPGDESPIIRGPGKRFWILKLVERRDEPSVSFESVRAPLIESLRMSRLAEVREGAERDLLGKAHVVYRGQAPAAAN